MSRGRVLRHGVPAPFRYEAVSSWLSRLVVAQGCSLEEVLDFLEIGPAEDLDLELHGVALYELRRKCSLPRQAFLMADRAMARVSKGQLGEDLLLKDPSLRPRFRFCPACLKSVNSSAFSVAWRFVDKRYCPRHRCLLEERCQRCSFPVRFPKDIAESKAGRDGHASQRRCMRCAADLAAILPCPVNPTPSAVLSGFEARWISDGCALVRALFMPDEKCVPQLLQDYSRFYPLPSASQWNRVARRLHEVHRLGRDMVDLRRPNYRSVDHRENWGARLARSLEDGAHSSTQGTDHSQTQGSLSGAGAGAGTRFRP